MALARWLMLGMLLLGCLVGIGSAVAVTGPVVIEKPGTYELTKDILGSKEPVCIEIRCDDVVLDGKGHLIRSVDAANSAESGPRVRTGIERRDPEYQDAGLFLRYLLLGFTTGVLMV